MTRHQKRMLKQAAKQICLHILFIVICFVTLIPILYGNGYAVCVWHGSENKQNFRNLWHDCRIGVDDDLFEYLFYIPEK